MSEIIRIANCSGFYGDRLAAAAEMVKGEEALMFSRETISLS